MRYEIIKGLVSQEECKQLNAWADKAVENDWLDAGIHMEKPYPKELRRTSRFYGSRFEHPPLALEIFQRIRDTLNLPNAPLVTGHGRDGIVINYIMDGGSIYEHTDAPHYELAVLRCNLLSSAPEAGGELFVEDTEYPMYETAVHCYLVSKHRHRVEEVHGDKPRILWMFGFAVNANDWNSGRIQVKHPQHELKV